MVRGILAALLVAAAAQAQLSRTTERIDVNVVEVDVVVLDAAGKPVTGLSRNDFELRVAGRTCPITNFYEVDRRPHVSPPTTTQPSAEPGAAAAVARRDHVLIFVDELHLNFGEKRRVLDALRGFIRREVRPGTAAMLVDFDGAISILERFTEDPALLLRSIDVIDRKPAHLGEYESARRELVDTLDRIRAAPDLKRHLSLQLPGMIDRVANVAQTAAERTMDAIGTVVKMIGGLDGRRVLVYVSDGLPMQPGIEVTQLFQPEEFTPPDPNDAAAYKALTQFQALDTMKHNLQALLQRLGTQAAVAGVQFFAVDARGAQGFEELTRNASATLSRLDSNLVRGNLQGPIQFLADETGGQAIVNQNDMNAAFGRLSEHLSSYYSLGFRSDGRGRDGDVAVRVKRRGLTIRATKHVRQQTAREQIADRVRASLYAAAEDNPLNVTIAVDPVTGSDSGLTLTVRVPLADLSVLPGQPTSFAVAVALLDEQNRETPVRMFLHRVNPSEFEESVQTLALRVAPGSYTVSVAIVDGFSSQASFLQRQVRVPSGRQRH